MPLAWVVRMTVQAGKGAPTPDAAANEYLMALGYGQEDGLLPLLASAPDAKPPRRIPRWLGRLAAGEAATVMMTEVRGASNERAKRELGWRPRYASWRQGFVQGLG